MDAALRGRAHSRLTFNAPLSERRATGFVDQLALAPGHHALDLACGWGELLLRIVAARPAATGTGVDTDRAALDRGRAAAARRGLHDRVEFVEADAVTIAARGHLVLCVGATHAWGGPAAALRALEAHLEPGGVALVGTGFWEREPSDSAVALLGDHPSLGGLLATARDNGWVVESHETSSLEEWDDFEAGWRAGLEHSDDTAAHRLADVRRGEYLEVYRALLGFAWLVLRARHRARTR